MWEIYDALIDGIPEDLIVDELISGYEASYVRSGNGAGIAYLRDYQTRMPMFTKNLIGAPCGKLPAPSNHGILWKPRQVLQPLMPITITRRQQGLTGSTFLMPGGLRTE